MSRIIFSERKGFTAVPSIQKEGVSQELRHALWNAFIETDYNIIVSSDKRLSAQIWSRFFKRPLDELPTDLSQQVKALIVNGEWNRIYDMLEFILGEVNSDVLNRAINLALERELSGYRYVRGIFTDITSEQELETLHNALEDQEFPNVHEHLAKALKHLTNRNSPDYRNSIKESISAVESLAKTISRKPKAELGDALKEIEKKRKLHGALKQGFLNLYGYTSDADGIRHGLMEEPDLTADDAKFFLLICASFINYLKVKI